MSEKPFVKLSVRKPLSANPPETRYEVLCDGTAVVRGDANYMYWDKCEERFCVGDMYLYRRNESIEWRLWEESKHAPAPQGDAMCKDDKEQAIWRAIQNIKIGNKTDDKLILSELEKIGFTITPIAALQQQTVDVEGLLEGIKSDIWPDNVDEYFKGIRCGVEDRDLYDRYECAEYGYEQALEYALSCIPDIKGIKPRTPLEKVEEDV